MTTTEQAVKEWAEVNGFTVLHRGWPDFLCFRSNEGHLELHAVEVKSENDIVRKEQQEVLSLLSNVMPVYVIRDDGKELRIKQVQNA